MKTLFSCLCLLFITTSNAQDIRGIWKSSSLIKDKEIEEYTLSPAEENDHWGLFIDFTDLNTFTSYSSWPCGNDCFITAKGTYNLSHNTISFFLIDVKFNKEYCGDMKPLKNTNLGTFTITHNGENIILKKVKKQSSKD